MSRSQLITLVLGTGTFLTLFDVTAVVVAMPGIARDLGFTVAGVAWVIDAYSLAFTGALLASGALADRFGRRRALLGGNVVFLLASIACGAAPSGSLLLAARVVQGLGAAFLVTGAMALVAAAFPDRDARTRAFGTIGVTSGIAMALGPTVGGLLASWLGWSWIFYANVPVCLGLMLAVPRLVAESRDPGGRPVDAWGVALLTLSLCLAVDALLRRDAAVAVTLACIAATAVALLAFVLHQRRSRHPVLDPRVFARPAMVAVGAMLLAVQFGYWAVLVYLPLFLSAALGIGMDVAGTSLLAATLPMLLLPLVGGRLVTRWGWRRIFAIAFVIVVLGDLLLAASALSADPAMRLAGAFAGMGAIGIGAALANPQLSSVALALSPPAQAGMTVAATMVARQAGFAISIAALGAALPTTSDAPAFATPFALAATATLLGVFAALRLPRPAL